MQHWIYVIRGDLAYRCQVVKKVKFLNDQSIYWGNQLECEFGGDRYFGNLVGMDFIMTCTCEENGENLELLLWKNRIIYNKSLQALPRWEETVK